MLNGYNNLIFDENKEVGLICDLIKRYEYLKQQTAFHIGFDHEKEGYRVRIYAPSQKNYLQILKDAEELLAWENVPRKELDFLDSCLEPKRVDE